MEENNNEEESSEHAADEITDAIHSLNLLGDSLIYDDDSDVSEHSDSTFESINMTESQSVDLIQLILEELKCPICYDIMQPIPGRFPLSCINGHSSCSACVSRLRRCATCRSDLGWGRCLVLENLSDQLIKMSMINPASPRPEPEFQLQTTPLTNIQGNVGRRPRSEPNIPTAVVPPTSTPARSTQSLGGHHNRPFFSPEVIVPSTNPTSLEPSPTVSSGETTTTTSDPTSVRQVLIQQVTPSQPSSLYRYHRDLFSYNRRMTAAGRGWWRPTATPTVQVYRSRRELEATRTLRGFNPRPTRQSLLTDYWRHSVLESNPDQHEIHTEDVNDYLDLTEDNNNISDMDEYSSDGVGGNRRWRRSLRRGRIFIERAVLGLPDIQTVETGEQVTVEEAPADSSSGPEVAGNRSQITDRNGNISPAGVIGSSETLEGDTAPEQSQNSYSSQVFAVGPHESEQETTEQDRLDPVLDTAMHENISLLREMINRGGHGATPSSEQNQAGPRDTDESSEEQSETDDESLAEITADR